ncbi:uncharacterized protein SETTUDRAFT_36415 [Exserohilum turcica Et28A]|uniref:Uncharacterized protein n=1 Tax=Exserohilum turcicum (strain 28A) TaxID=671987 RepID=R0KDC7_EXST2|nr:uncharacterized protein SETTUDRAFT_36415 [Exserohilum turcica Et28A]EOA90918.1 hypothetical protein SETTUDRAFT_36415 [Exserohilum turcica Et28A]
MPAHGLPLLAWLLCAWSCACACARVPVCAYVRRPTLLDDASTALARKKKSQAPCWLAYDLGARAPCLRCMTRQELGDSRRAVIYEPLIIDTAAATSLSWRARAREGKAREGHGGQEWERGTRTAKDMPPPASTAAPATATATPIAPAAPAAAPAVAPAITTIATLPLLTPVPLHPHPTPSPSLLQFCYLRRRRRRQTKIQPHLLVLLAPPWPPLRPGSSRLAVPSVEPVEPAPVPHASAWSCRRAQMGARLQGKWHSSASRSGSTSGLLNRRRAVSAPFLVSRPLRGT